MVARRSNLLSLAMQSTSHSTQERCTTCDMILYRGSCLDCVPPQLVKGVLGVTYLKATCRSVARGIVAAINSSPPETIVQQCELARHLDIISHQMPGVMLQLPSNLLAFHTSRTVMVMNALEEQSGEQTGPVAESSITETSSVNGEAVWRGTSGPTHLPKQRVIVSG